LCIFVSFFIIFIITFLSKNLKNTDSKISNELIRNIITNDENIVDSDKYNQNLESSINNYQNKWKIEIPSIDLCAEIREWTDEKTLNEYVAHFEETPLLNGNVCLAAHNRGYKVNYFSNIKNLNIGDEIQYFINGKTYKYEIHKILIIDETDWTMLENTKDNRITLITCIENKEEYRLCIQGIKKKEDLW